MLSGWPIYLQNWVVLVVNVGKHTIHGASGIGNPDDLMDFLMVFPKVFHGHLKRHPPSAMPHPLQKRRLRPYSGIIYSGQFITTFPAGWSPQMVV